MDKYFVVTDFDVGREVHTEEYVKSLEKRERWLRCLEIAGVDNWQGMDCVYDVMQEYFPEDVED